MNKLISFLKQDKRYQSWKNYPRRGVYLGWTKTNPLTKVYWEWDTFNHQLFQERLIKKYWIEDIWSEVVADIIWKEFTKKDFYKLLILALTHDVWEMHEDIWDVCKNWTAVAHYSADDEMSVWIEYLKEIFWKKANWVIDIYKIDFWKSSTVENNNLNKLFKLYEKFSYLNWAFITYKLRNTDKKVQETEYLIHNVIANNISTMVEYYKKWLPSYVKFVNDNFDLISEMIEYSIQTWYQEENEKNNEKFKKWVNDWKELFWDISEEEKESEEVI